LSIEQAGKEPITITPKTSACLTLSILLDRSNQSGFTTRPQYPEPIGTPGEQTFQVEQGSDKFLSNKFFD
jgi:hypothetical protein